MLASKNLRKFSSSHVYESAPGNGKPSRKKSEYIFAIGSNVPSRLVLYFLSWSGFLVSFMMRNDINFAIVAMTTTNAESYKPPMDQPYLAENATLEAAWSNMTTNATLEAALNSFPNTHLDADTADVYNWSSTVKSFVVSSFYWCYVLSQVVGGMATQYFGTKHVFGWSQFATAFCSLCIPFAADIHYSAVIALRSIQGFASGLTWPAMYALVGSWIPLSERSRFMSSFQGFSIGIGLTYPLCGFLIDHLGWRYVFYTTGTLGMFWCFMWYFLAFNTPREHPRISADELDYIEGNVSADLKQSQNVKVPWRKIFLSIPAWAIAITTFGRIWIHYIFIVCGPNFMKNILEFDYKTNGFLSGMPFICSYISSVLFCYCADKLVLHQWLKLTNVRKLFTGFSQIVPGILIFCIGYIENVVLLLILWFIAVTFITASYAGAMANIVDISPNFAGPVLAFCQTIHMSASFISPLVAGVIVTNEQSINEWRAVFAITAVVSFLTYLVYLIWGSAEIQHWNYIRPRNGKFNEDSRILEENPADITSSRKESK